MADKRSEGPVFDHSSWTPEQHCAHANANHAAKSKRTDVAWFVRDGQVVMGWTDPSTESVKRIKAKRVDVMDRRGLPMSESDTFALNTELEKLGATARYRRDGSRYTITEAGNSHG